MKNILRENMRRFGTKNLLTENTGSLSFNPDNQPDVRKNAERSDIIYNMAKLIKSISGTVNLYNNPQQADQSQIKYRGNVGSNSLSDWGQADYFANNISAQQLLTPLFPDNELDLQITKHICKYKPFLTRDYRLPIGDYDRGLGRRYPIYYVQPSIDKNGAASAYLATGTPRHENSSDMNNLNVVYNKKLLSQLNDIILVGFSELQKQFAKNPMPIMQ